MKEGLIGPWRMLHARAKLSGMAAYRWVECETPNDEKTCEQAQRRQPVAASKHDKDRPIGGANRTTKENKRGKAPNAKKKTGVTPELI